MKKVCVVISILAVMLVSGLSGSAWAEILPGEMGISVMGGGYGFDDENDLLDLGKTFTLGLGYNFTRNIGTELLFSYVHSDADVCCSDDDVYMYQGQLDLLYHFMPEGSFVPYLVAGVGGMMYDDDNIEPNEIDDTFQVNGGLGVKYFITPNFALRFDGRYYHGFEDSSNEYALRAGLEFQLGSTPEKREAEPCTDADNDGVCDDVDKCPDTVANVRVDSEGCQIKSEPYAVMEKSGETAQPVAVSDVPPPPPAPEMMEVVIYFDFDHTQVKSLFHKQLEKLADHMKAHPELNAAIEGHTDSLGAADYNMELSRKRAESVKQFMVENYGIEASRFEARPMGETQPAEPNNTAEGRRLNRRAITITIME
ncbi:hypothetical protein DENIS_1418 [Desulfonema ishimotonii]|uniref:OmpA-like domain-containing protein n=1 Tax=Desulfonema ishimotonii TaxID=45657 RepID=A0A401FU35_9BACT|nr:OmpA family protein [Desulfonema ishimotonii]GBC60465.1 hypothetical protein DENIS_1418 [Desulfonema ishimotonii]